MPGDGHSYELNVIWRNGIKQDSWVQKSYPTTYINRIRGIKSSLKDINENDPFSFALYESFENKFPDV